MNPIVAYSLPRDDAALLVVDYQERLFAAMPSKAGERHLANVVRLLKGAGALELPVVVTEQYPKGLGPTLPALRAAQPDLAPVEKTEFSCCANPEARAAIAATGRKRVIVAGMETHVCVYQTVLDLLAAGYWPHVVSDACLSRTQANWSLGLRMCKQAGAVVTGTETALFQLLGRAGGDAFKTISKLVK